MKLSYFSLLLLLLFALSACDQNAGKQASGYRTIEGQTMGTTFHITYKDSTGIERSGSVDSLLKVVNLSMSTYIDSSIIQQFNRSMDTTAWLAVDEHFATVFQLSKTIYTETGGAFNPAVMPLVNAWGFGFEEIPVVDSMVIDSLLHLVNFEAATIRKSPEGGYEIHKSIPGLQLDFSAIAKGYGVDAIGRWMEQQGIVNYMVEIGGEVRTRGKNMAGQAWRIGIDKPNDDRAAERQMKLIVPVSDESMATSGNYRNFYMKDGRKYVHTINPATGYPEVSNTLSVTVMSGDCATADAFATALMVLGLEKGMALVKGIDGLEACFIYVEGGEMATACTEALESRVAKLP